MEISPETKIKLDKFFGRVDELIPPAETVRLKPSRGETTVFDSKLGGVPYFPKAMEYPTVREGVYAGKPLKLLAQLNFGALPKLEGFPTEGILQFFAFPDDLYGADFDAPCDQNSFRIIYHEQLTTDTSALIDSVPALEIDEELFPFTGEFLLTADEPAKMGVVATDFRFDEAAATAYNELFGGDVIGMWDEDGKGIRQVDEELYSAIHSRYSNRTRVGGYPFFMQEDPRGYNEEYACRTIMLFQCDSESGGEGLENEVCWGDAGVANFFITSEDLAKRDFSRVMYTWDCG